MEQYILLINSFTSYDQPINGMNGKPLEMGIDPALFAISPCEERVARTSLLIFPLNIGLYIRKAGSLK